MEHIVYLVITHPPWMLPISTYDLESFILLFVIYVTMHINFVTSIWLSASLAGQWHASSVYLTHYHLTNHFDTVRYTVSKKTAFVLLELRQILINFGR